MKRKLLIVAMFLWAASARAQWVVYDPAVHTQQILNEVQDMAKYVQMINNQVQQIQQLSSQLQQLQQYNRAFGDPSKLVNIVGVNGLVLDLDRNPVGHTITDLERADDGTAALTYNGNGVYLSIGSTFNTPSGQTVQRTVANYKPFEAVNKTAENYTNVTADVLARRKTLKVQIAATTEKLQSATTASEVQKLTGVLIGLNAALSAADKEIDQAASISVVQDIENRNDREKQVMARTEEQQAEMLETFSNYHKTFLLNTTPPLFPEGQ